MAQIQESEEIKNHWRSRFPGLWCEEGGDRATEWGDSSLCQEKYTQAFDQCWDLSLKTVEERNILEIEEKTRAFSHELLDCVDTEVQNQ